VFVSDGREKAALRRALLKTHEEVGSRVGRDLIEAIYRETGFDPGKP
jgi:C4-dicarboxylate-binding protein DctP